MVNEVDLAACSFLSVPPHHFATPMLSRPAPPCKHAPGSLVADEAYTCYFLLYTLRINIICYCCNILNTLLAVLRRFYMVVCGQADIFVKMEHG